MIHQSEILKEAFEKHKQGELESAKELYLEILQEDKENAQAWNLLGVLNHQTNDFLEAELCIKKAIELSPRLYYLENLARLYLDKGEFKLAIALYEDLAKHNQTYENLFNLAMSYKGNHDWEKAKQTYHKSLEVNPNGYESYFNLAYLALNENNPDLAIECYQNALKIKRLFLLGRGVFVQDDKRCKKTRVITLELWKLFIDKIRAA